MGLAAWPGAPRTRAWHSARCMFFNNGGFACAHLRVVVLRLFDGGVNPGGVYAGLVVQKLTYVQAKHRPERSGARRCGSGHGGVSRGLVGPLDCVPRPCIVRPAVAHWPRQVMGFGGGLHPPAKLLMCAQGEKVAFWQSFMPNVLLVPVKYAQTAI